MQEKSIKRILTGYFTSPASSWITRHDVLRTWRDTMKKSANECLVAVKAADHDDK